ncbi:serine proteinase stubble-like [Sarcoptes scabiei]|nr:serine proteinase stubble-like [Sarcoptes scabiei]
MIEKFEDQNLDGANHIKSARLTSDFILSNQQSSSPSSSSRIAATTTTLIPEVVTVNGDNGGGVISTIAANVANNLPQRITVNPTTSSLASSSSFLSPSTLSELEKINQSFSNGFKSNTIGSNQTDPNISYDNNTNPENRLRWVDFGRHQGYPPRLPSIPGIPSGFRNPLATPPTTTSTQGFPLVASTTTTTTTTTTEASIEPIGMYDSGASFLTGSLGSNNLGFNINNPNLEDEIMFNVPNSNNMRRYNITRVEHIVAECSDEYMKVVVRFNGTFTGLIYSSGYVHDPNCIYVNGSGRNYYEFFIRLNQCGTLGRQEMYHPSMPGEARRRDQLMWNTLSIQYNAMIEEEFDEHFRLTCEYGSDFWKTVSFPGVNVEINTGSPVVFTINPPQCQMEIRRGFGIAGTRTSGPVTVGDPLTLLIHMKSDKVGFDILVKNCIAHNGAAQRMQLIDSNGCVTNDKLISPFRGTYNAENGHQVSLFAYLKAFRYCLEVKNIQKKKPFLPRS